MLFHHQNPLLEAFLHRNFWLSYGSPTTLRWRRVVTKKNNKKSFKGGTLMICIFLSTLNLRFNLFLIAASLSLILYVWFWFLILKVKSKKSGSKSKGNLNPNKSRVLQVFSSSSCKINNLSFILNLFYLLIISPGLVIILIIVMWIEVTTSDMNSMKLALTTNLWLL